MIFKNAIIDINEGVHSKSYAGIACLESKNGEYCLSFLNLHYNFYEQNVQKVDNQWNIETEHFRMLIKTEVVTEKNHMDETEYQKSIDNILSLLEDNFEKSFKEKAKVSFFLSNPEMSLSVLEISIDEFLNSENLIVQGDNFYFKLPKSKIDGILWGTDIDSTDITLKRAEQNYEFSFV